MYREIAKRIVEITQRAISFGLEPLAFKGEIAGKSLPLDLELQATNHLTAFISELEEKLGPQRIAYDSVSVKQSDCGPAFLLDGADAVVFVGPNATSYEPTFLANLAHESVHLLNATSGGASRLEEGLAVDFELEVIGRSFGVDEIRNFEQSFPKSYSSALIDYRRLLLFHSAAPTLIRREFGTLSGPTAAELRSLFPSLDRWLAYRLARRVRMR